MWLIFRFLICGISTVFSEEERIVVGKQPGQLLPLGVHHKPRDHQFQIQGIETIDRTRVKRSDERVKRQYPQYEWRQGSRYPMQPAHFQPAPQQNWQQVQQRPQVQFRQQVNRRPQFLQNPGRQFSQQQTPIPPFPPVVNQQRPIQQNQRNRFDSEYHELPPQPTNRPRNQVIAEPADQYTEPKVIKPAHRNIISVDVEYVQPTTTGPVTASTIRTTPLIPIVSTTTAQKTRTVAQTSTTTQASTTSTLPSTTTPLPTTPITTETTTPRARIVVTNPPRTTSQPITTSRSTTSSPRTTKTTTNVPITTIVEETTKPQRHENFVPPSLPPPVESHQEIEDKYNTGRYYYPPRQRLPLPKCFHNPTGYVCCNAKLNDAIVQTYTELEARPKFHTCNVQALATKLQRVVEEMFNTPFETIVAYDDFAQKVHFKGDLVCKVELGGKYMLAYATSRNVTESRLPKIEDKNRIDSERTFDHQINELRI